MNAASSGVSGFGSRLGAAAISPRFASLPVAADADCLLLPPTAACVLACTRGAAVGGLLCCSCVGGSKQSASAAVTERAGFASGEYTKGLRRGCFSLGVLSTPSCFSPLVLQDSPLVSPVILHLCSVQFLFNLLSESNRFATAHSSVVGVWRAGLL